MSSKTPCQSVMVWITRYSRYQYILKVWFESIFGFTQIFRTLYYRKDDEILEPRIRQIKICIKNRRRTGQIKISFSYPDHHISQSNTSPSFAEVLYTLVCIMLISLGVYTFMFCNSFMATKNFMVTLFHLLLINNFFIVT